MVRLAAAFRFVVFAIALGWVSQYRQLLILIRSSRFA